MVTDYLVLWKWREAERVRGRFITHASGRHSGGLKRGDRMFICATRSDELFLLGAIEVQRSGDRWAEGRSVYGQFKIIPLKGLKWRLRFQHTGSPRLSHDVPVAMQVRARRQPTPEAAQLLDQMLKRDFATAEHAIRLQEGKQKTMTLTKPERNPKLRAFALARRGHRCEICDFDFAERYGDYARYCVEVHHLKAMAGAGQHGRTVKLDDVVILCPNCHRALHRWSKDWSKGVRDWKGLKRVYEKQAQRLVGG